MRNILTGMVLVVALAAAPAAAQIYPPDWPQKIDLSVGETSAPVSIMGGGSRTLKLVSYQTLIERHKIQATIEVAGGGKTETQTLQVTFAGVPACVNGLRVYAYAWKEADDYYSPGFEPVGGQGDFPLTPGKDVGFAVNDAQLTLFPEMGGYTYPLTIAFHEGAHLQTWLDPDQWAHSGYDIGLHSQARIVAMRDGWAWFSFWGDQGGAYLTTTNDEWGDPVKWLWTHVNAGGNLVPNGTFVFKGTPIAVPWSNAGLPYHTHMGAKDSFDFGTWIFTAEVWNFERRNSFPAPRHWLVLGAYPGSVSGNHIDSNENGNLPDALQPRKGDPDLTGAQQWRFGDNFVNSVVRMGEVLSAAPFSGYGDADGTDSMGYAAVYIFSPADHTSDNLVHMKWGLSRGGKAWLNGQSIWSGTESRYDTYNRQDESPIVIDKYDLPLSLREGWNTLIIKTDHGSRGDTVWLFSPKIGDAAGQRISGIEFSTRDIDLQLTGRTPTTATVNWQHPNFHGTHVESYRVDVATNAAFVTPFISDLDVGMATNYSVTGLADGLRYYIRVRPYNASDVGGTTYWQHHDVVATDGQVVEPPPPPPPPPPGPGSGGGGGGSGRCGALGAEALLLLGCVGFLRRAMGGRRHG
ncbi:MAG: fibronectin type III domain-containing protein [Planctomycetes bacterium]|nr:fibronectin type III domain-containing protein [Planctomycetota bacterium]